MAEEVIYFKKEMENLEFSILDKINNMKHKTYYYNGRGVPRVTDILKDCIGTDYLMRWAANLGKDKYQKESTHTLYIGTLVHEMIEHFLVFGEYKKVDFRSYDVKMKTEKAFGNFLKWYNDMINQGFKINAINIEKQTINPWFGGTIDAVMELTLNGISKTFIVDFKTSKKNSINYLIQTYAYYWSENWKRSTGDNSIKDLSGLAIIRIDKEKDIYEDLFLDFNNPNNYKFLEDIHYAFINIINWYYYKQNLNSDLKVMKQLREEGFINGKFN